MAKSDNVVRAGLTPKFKNVSTLVQMLTYNPTPPSSIIQSLPKVNPDYPHTVTYNSLVPEFNLSRTIIIDGNYQMPMYQLASIFLVVKGHGKVQFSNDSSVKAHEEVVDITTGFVAVIPGLSTGESNKTLKLFECRDLEIFVAFEPHFNDVITRLK